MAVEYWLGMTDSETEGVWRWYDKGSQATYLNWVGSEPQDTFGAEDCVVYSGDQGYRLGDISCERTFRALCEQK